MKALTIRQPHAALIAYELKLIESRPRATKFRGEIAIHAGAFWSYATSNLRFELSHQFPELGKFFLRTAMCYGAVIATAELYDCVPAEQLALTDMERAFGDYSAGRYGWLLRNIRRLDEPVYCKGQLGLWNWQSDHQ